MVQKTDNFENIVLQTIRSRRTIRCFQDTPISNNILYMLIDCARLYASGGNYQPIRFAIISQKPATDRIFELSKWAMYLPNYAIDASQRPTAYIALLRDRTISRPCQFDAGAAATTLMIAAQSMGIASCCLGTCPEDKLLNLLNSDNRWTVEAVIALGYPAQTSVEVPFEGTIEYRMGQDSCISVPKYSAQDVIVFNDAEAAASL